MAICCESFKGKWPFIISPRQVIVLPLSEKFLEYAEQVYNRFKLENYNVELDVSSNTLNKKIRNAQLLQFNYICVVGQKEQEQGGVDVRSRDQKEKEGRMGFYTVGQFVEYMGSLSPDISDQEKQIMTNSYFNKEQKQDDNELKQWNEELRLKMYFSGDGFVKGEKDEEVYEKVKDVEVSEEMPNLYRWKKAM